MKSITSVIIALGLLTSSAAIAADNTGNAPGGTGIEQSTKSMGATNKQVTPVQLDRCRAVQTLPTQVALGVKGSAEGKGAWLDGN